MKNIQLKLAEKATGNSVFGGITKKVIPFLILIFLVSCASSMEGEDVQDSFIKDVDAGTFKKLIDAGGGIILDVRTSEETEQGHIPGASMVNYYDKDFEEKIRMISKDKDIFVYCRTGARSSEAVRILQENGFNRVFHLKNGIIEWERSGFPLERSVVEADENIRAMQFNEFEELLNTDKPVLVNFHTVWCAPCRKMAPVVDKIEAEYGEKAVVIRIDADKSRELAGAYNVSGVPVFILFKDGNKKWNHTGIIAEEALREQIDKNL